MWQFAKGHGTLNDFVLITDEDDSLAPTDDEVRFLCDRRAGIGGDGLLRAVRAGRVDGWDGDPDLWFMDYRNADGSLAEMCGNGLRVFARYLQQEGLVSDGPLTVATRAGLRRAECLHDGQVRVWMGPVRIEPDQVIVSCGDASWPALSVNVGNPHAVSEVGPGVLDALDLSLAPTWEPADSFPHGTNAEFIEVLGPRHARMRVYERGVGETASCGTGTVAVAATLASRLEVAEDRFDIDVPGGRIVVELGPDGSYLTGPAVIVARGGVDVGR